MQRQKIVLISILFLIFSGTAGASTIIPVDLETMAHKAGSIFYGRCSDVRLEEDERGLTSTVVTYDVIRNSKGEDGSTITFRIFGVATTEEGSSQPTTIWGIPPFTEGREDVLFLYPVSDWGFTSPVGLWQGSFPVEETEDGPQLRVENKSYRNALKNRNVKDARRIERSNVRTPDQLLDEVEEILGKKPQ